MSQKKILIVDDEKNILSTLKSALELEGFECDVAGSAEIGLEKLVRGNVQIVLGVPQELRVWVCTNG